MKENTKRYVKLSIILYIVILSVALVGTLAWFIYDKSAIVSTEDNAKIIAGEYLEIKLKDQTEWQSEIKLASDKQYPDISYNPETKSFYYPTQLDANDGLILNKPGVCIDVTDSSGYFMKIELTVRASKGMKVYLDNTSFFKGVNENENVKDYVAGAARVAFYAGDDLKTVWVPNPTYEYKIAADGTGTVKTDGTPETTQKFIKMKADGTIEGLGDWNTDNFSIGNDSLATAGVAGDAISILDFAEAGEQDLTIYVWVEGTDRESVTALAGGSFNYEIKLIGISKNSNNSLNIDDVNYRTGELFYASTGEEAGGELLYSYNGKDWAQYSDSNPAFAKGKKVVYVRAKETATEMAGPVKEIIIKR